MLSAYINIMLLPQFNKKVYYIELTNQVQHSCRLCIIYFVGGYVQYNSLLRAISIDQRGSFWPTQYNTCTVQYCTVIGLNWVCVHIYIHYTCILHYYCYTVRKSALVWAADRRRLYSMYVCMYVCTCCYANADCDCSCFSFLSHISSDVLNWTVPYCTVHQQKSLTSLRGAREILLSNFYWSQVKLRQVALRHRDTFSLLRRIYPIISVLLFTSLYFTSLHFTVL